MANLCLNTAESRCAEAMDGMTDLLGARAIDKSEPLDDPRTHEVLAARALNLVMRPGRETFDETADDIPYHAIIEALSEAFCADDPDMRRRAVSELLLSGVSGKEFIHSHAGDTARLLGDLWADNKISFAETTIGVARLQETVRTLAASHELDQMAGVGSEILLVAPEGEHHLLGLFIACEAFQDAGCYVHLAFGQSPDEIRQLAQKTQFAMIGISVSSNRTVKEARAIVKKLRSGLTKNVPIVLGGSLMTDSLRHDELIAETGVNHITCDPLAALRHCGVEFTASFKEGQIMTPARRQTAVR